MDFPRPSLTLVTNRKLYRPPAGKKGEPLSLVEAAIAGGVQVVQLRAGATDGGDLGLFAVAMRLREMTVGKALFVVTGDLDLAERCHADGVLLPESSYKPSEAREFLRADTVRLVGSFARTVMGASRAERGGADYVQFGPVVGGDEHEPIENGFVMLRKVKDAVHIPVIAFGGIQTSEHAIDALRAGADGIAVTEAITRAPDPEAAAAAFRTAINAAWRALYGA